MGEFSIPDIAIGALVLSAAILFAAWHEYAAKNQRDAKLLVAGGWWLVAVGAVSVFGGIAAWI
jgi:hypothetical protein